MTEIYKDTLHHIKIDVVSTSDTLFNKTSFLNYQSQKLGATVIIFKLFSNEKNKLLASIDFASALDNKKWFTPVTGAFSHISSESKTSSSSLELFINQVIIHLKKQKNASEIIWKTPPLYFDEFINHKIHNIMFRTGWKTLSSELNFHFDVTTLENFRRGLNSTKRKELNKWNRSNSMFSLAGNEQDREACYRVIRENREAQNYPVTMSYEAISDLFHEMKEDVLFFSLAENKELVASAIVLRLNNSVLYVFYWGESPAHRARSPVVKICECLYQYAIENNFKILDIGISTNHSLPNEGLVNFKFDIGCRVSQKQIFHHD